MIVTLRPIGNYAIIILKMMQCYLCGAPYPFEKRVVGDFTILCGFVEPAT